MDIEKRIKDCIKNFAEFIEETEKDTEEILIRDYGKTALRGYGIFICGVREMPLEHIESIDELGVYENDHEASQQAEKDGIKILETHFVNEPFCYYNGTIIDTEENRKMLEDIQAEDKDFR